MTHPLVGNCGPMTQRYRGQFGASEVLARVRYPIVFTIRDVDLCSVAIVFTRIHRSWPPASVPPVGGCRLRPYGPARPTFGTLRFSALGISQFGNGASARSTCHLEIDRTVGPLGIDQLGTVGSSITVSHHHTALFYLI